MIDADAIEPMIAAGDNPYLVRTKIIALENTHNIAGGVVSPVAAVSRVRQLALRHRVAVHMDGARLWNACAATGAKPHEYAELADTVSVCLSKGLGAPAGSVLAGTTQAIQAARVWRKRLGAGMRQVGYLAAAGLYALDHHRTGLERDHANARVIARSINNSTGAVDPERVDSNIVVFVTGDAAALVHAAEQQGVRVMAFGPHTVRAATYRDLSDEDVAYAARVLSHCCEQVGASCPDPRPR